MKLKLTLTSLAALALLTGIAFAVNKPALTAPSLQCYSSTGASITLRVTGTGNAGAPAGFSIQYMTLADYTANGWPADSDNPPAGSTFCKASFSGNASGYNYALASGAFINVTLGDTLFDTPGASSPCEGVALTCGTSYVFRTFAHANAQYNKSPFSANTTCSTSPCGGAGCTLTQGYWKTHGSSNCNPSGGDDLWPADIQTNGMFLGTVHYEDGDLCEILNTTAATKGGPANGLVNLAHQLIAAKLNIANGADGSAVAQAIADADALIGGLIVPSIGSGFLAPSTTSSLVTTLTNYNEGAIGPGHCQ
jgi:hypothetical protein